MSRAAAIALLSLLIASLALNGYQADVKRADNAKIASAEGMANIWFAMWADAERDASDLRKGKCAVPSL